MSYGHLPPGHLPTGHLPTGHLPEFADDTAPVTEIPRRLVVSRSMARRWIIGMNEEIGTPYGCVDPKRSYAEAFIGVDWHDYLVNRRIPGVRVEVGYRFRPLRAEATGVQYQCSVAGVCNGREFNQLRWPTTGTYVDGGVTWTAEPIADTSLRATISAEAWPEVTGLTLSAPASADLRYTTKAVGGSSGRSYPAKHQITLSNGEKAEGVVILPVMD